MERQSRVLLEANEIVKRQEKRERRKRTLRRARNALALVAVATTVTASEYAVTSQMSHQQYEPSCFALKVECPWPLSTPTPVKTEPTHVSVPEHEVAPNVNKNVR